MAEVTFIFDEMYDVVVDGTKKVLFTGGRRECERWIFAHGDLNVLYAMEKHMSKKSKKKSGGKKKNEKGNIKDKKGTIDPLF